MLRKSALDYTLKVRVPIALFVVVVAFTLTYYVSRSERDGVGYAPVQPIAFSHALHAGSMKIDCKYCHAGAERSRHATIPAANVCMNCHAVARKDKPEIVKLRKAYESGTPIQWMRVHRLASFAYFNHSVHVNKGIDCVECHGDVAAMEKITQVSSFTMGACLDCHRNSQKRLPALASMKTGPENCFACHR